MADFEIGYMVRAYTPQDLFAKLTSKLDNFKGMFGLPNWNRATPISNAKKKKGMPSLRSGININNKYFARQ